jgi:hypothetical protein
MYCSCLDRFPRARTHFFAAKIALPAEKKGTAIKEWLSVQLHSEQLLEAPILYTAIEGYSQMALRSLQNLQWITCLVLQKNSINQLLM